MNNFKRIYENLKQRNPNSSESDLRRQAWVVNDRQMFEATVNISPSSAAAGAGGSGNIPKFFTLKITLDLGEGGIGYVRVPFDYVRNWNQTTIFTYYFAISDDKNFTIEYNTEENRWELITDEAIDAISTISPYEGWISINQEESGILDIDVELGMTRIRNFCLTHTFGGIFKGAINPIEVKDENDDKIIFYIMPVMINVGFPQLLIYEEGEDTWYLAGEFGSLLLGGTYNNFPSGTFDGDGFSVTITDGFCPL